MKDTLPKKASWRDGETQSVEVNHAESKPEGTSSLHNQTGKSGAGEAQVRDCAHRVPADRQTFMHRTVSRECILQNAEPHSAVRVGTPLRACKNVEREGFLKKQIFIYMAVLGLSFGMWDLLSLLQHAGSLVAAWEF